MKPNNDQDIICNSTIRSPLNVKRKREVEFNQLIDEYSNHIRFNNNNNNNNYNNNNNNINNNNSLGDKTDGNSKLFYSNSRYEVMIGNKGDIRTAKSA